MANGRVVSVRTEPVAIVGAIEALVLSVWSLLVLLLELDPEVAAGGGALIATAIGVLATVVRGLVTPVNGGAGADPADGSR